MAAKSSRKKPRTGTIRFSGGSSSGTPPSSSTEKIKTTDNRKGTVSTAQDKVTVTLEYLENLASEVHSQEEQVRDLGDKVDKLASKFKRQQIRADKQREELNTVREKVTETLAVFVAIFTFISVNFDFFSTCGLNPLVFVGLELVLGVFLLLFVFVLMGLSGYKRFGPKDIYVLMMLCGVLILVGTVVVVFGYTSGGGSRVGCGL